MGKILRKLFLVLVALIMFAAGASPEDVHSNISHWYDFITGFTPPTWLSNNNADYVVIGFGAAIIFGYFISWAFIGHKVNVPPSPHVTNRSDEDEFDRGWDLASGNLIHLPDACRTAYDETINGVAAGVAERFSHGDPAKVLDWYATAITGFGEAILFGAKSPSDKQIEIPIKEIKRRNFIGGGWLLESIDENDFPYRRLAVTKTDLENAIERIKGMDATAVPVI